MKKNKLNLKQQLFCDWYIKLGGFQHGTEAMIKAGYSAKTATVNCSKLLTRPNIQAYLDKRKHELEELLGFNKSTILKDLQEIKAKSMQAKPVMEWDRDTKQMEQVVEVNEEGKEVGVFLFDSNGANRAIENIGKMMGYYAPEKIEVENKTPTEVLVNINLSKTTVQDGNEQTDIKH